ncbi:Fic family protein [Delftia tsuruhatensis]|jgi:Fic family protein|uniref:Fic family protein n=1 Tax=Delftia tsuruhatensis TaxID=180282 RepID=UPI000DB160B6|nr:Fic family protein [Delftia tsuruhatensis]MDH0775911.1 Fic family protein [Delftia tsuruhatensis]MDH1459464.1 Fic family protein [Delftia tsuruhatensis]PZP64423.1 MAG: cell filamentation protein Fic [Delftia acidovorans]WGG13126.1 Fic family protein [Delftia tsuruhatensis]
MYSLSPDYLAKLRFDTQQLATLRALGEYRGKQQLYIARSPEVLSDLRQVAVVESTESSNRLAGVVVAAHRLKSMVLKNATPQSRSEQEVAGYRDALSLIHESGDQMPFSEGTVLQLQGILYRYMPQPGGHWKATNNDIIERHPDGSSRIRFRPVAAHLTPMAMTDMVARYHTALDQHLADPLVLVPLIALDFLCIHPFPDGNGRMARLLTLQLLYHFDYAVGRFISLERIFEESKESYCETLEASSQQWHDAAHNIAPWLDYFWGALLRAYKEFEERVGTIERGRGAKGDRVRAEILKCQLPFSISEIEEACPGVSRDMVRVILRAMKAEGLIEPNGKGRGAKWQHKRP